MLHKVLGTVRNSERLRKLRVSVASIAVLAGIGMFTLMPTQPALSLTVNENYVGGARQIVYGSVATSKGDPIEDAIVKLFHRKNGRWIRDMAATTDDEGLYRKVLHENPGRYKIVLRLKKGSDVKASRFIRFKRGYAVEVSAKITKKGILTVLPIFHY